MSKRSIVGALWMNVIELIVALHGPRGKEGAGEAQVCSYMVMSGVE